MGLNLDFDITHLRGATYNPRKIEEADSLALCESITTLGVVKPIIVRDKLIVAGHQRTKALRKLGIDRAPVYELPVNVTTYDEVRFNQLHNGTDMDSGDERATIEGGFTELGYHIVEPSRIRGNQKAKLAVVRKEIADLIVNYGPWGGCVATQSGEIIHCAQYALAAKLTNTKLTTYVVPDARAAEYKARLSRQYGVFSYDHLERRTYIQLLAQMNRLRPNDKGAGLKSTLYETLVLRWLAANPTAEVMDFGSGHGDYARMLRARGRKVSEVELFRRVDSAHALDMVTNLAKRIADGRRFDAVVCDSVMNSVDTLEAEKSVMTMLNALVPVGGQVFFSGRTQESVDSNLNMTASRNKVRYVEFLDEHGFSALYRKGQWFYQKFHTRAQATALCELYGLEVVEFPKASTGTSWQIHARKVKELDQLAVMQAIDYEFNLPVSQTARLGMNTLVKEAFAPLYGTSNPN